MRIVSLVAALLVSAVLAIAVWWAVNQPVTVSESYEGPMRSMSFAPYREGQSPLTKQYPSPEQIEEDLAMLQGQTLGVRTYTSQEGMHVVPEFAAKYGLQVTHSAWLGVPDPKDPGRNEREVAALIEQANRYPEVISRVIVGNEVMLRRDLTVDQLIAYIRQVKAAVKQPVSYADVWAFYLKYPQLADEVDFLTIHILPYWEDEPQDVAHSEEHVVKIVKRMQEAFPGKPILIGEAGWPTAGRSRGPAVPSVENGARFVRAMARLSQEHGFDYNIVEAFDQPWKAALEGTVGAKWGVVSASRDVKFGMSGPIVANPDWRLWAGLSVLLGLALTLAHARFLAAMGAGAQVAYAAFAQLLSSLLVFTVLTKFQLAFSIWQELWAAVLSAVLAALTLAVLNAAANAQDRRHRDASARSACASLRLPWGRLGLLDGGWGERLYLLLAGTAIVLSLLIAFDGRYRDIPVVDFLVPVASVLGLAALRLREGVVAALSFGGLFNGAAKPAHGTLRLDKALAALLVACSAGVVLSEGWAVMAGEDFKRDHPELSEQLPLLVHYMVSNREMWVWAAMLVLLALPFLGNLLRRKV